MLNGPTDSDVRYHSVRMDRPSSSKKAMPGFLCAKGDISHHICETRELMALQASGCAIKVGQGNGCKRAVSKKDQRPEVQAKQARLEMIIRGSKVRYHATVGLCRMCTGRK